MCEIPYAILYGAANNTDAAADVDELVMQAMTWRGY